MGVKLVEGPLISLREPHRIVTSVGSPGQPLGQRGRGARTFSFIWETHVPGDTGGPCSLGTWVQWGKQGNVMN